MTTPIPDVRTDGRTHYEAALDVRYAIRWNALNETFFARLDAGLKIVSLLFSTSAVAAYLVTWPRLAAMSALLLALLTIFDVVVSPGRKVCQFNEARRRFTELDAQALDLDLAQLERAMRALYSQHTTAGIGALEPIAYNANVIAAGRADYARSTSWWEQAIGRVAGQRHVPTT